MGRRLARTVIVADEHGRSVAFTPRDEDIPDWAVVQITNDAAWAPPGYDVLARAGAARSELEAYLEVWAGLSDARRADVVDDEPSDVDARDFLRSIHAFMESEQVSFVDALREALTRDDETVVVEPVVEPAVVEPPVVTHAFFEVPKPTPSGSKKAWVTYAVSQGMDAAFAESKTRDDLAGLFPG